MTDKIVVLSTSSSKEEAEKIARLLVEERLAACVSVGVSVDSLYHWRGEIETAQEVPVAIKTRAGRYAAVEAAILARHPYELPEVLAVPISHGLERYLEWIDAETAG